MEALIATLEGGEFRFNYRTDAIGRVTHLFFAHSKSLELLHKYPDVLLLDCTYRTNKFKMLLLNIVSTTCLDSNFHAAFCFLAKEEEGDYIWAMEQLKELFLLGMRVWAFVTDREIAVINACRNVFPAAARLLCLWDVEKNVLTHASEDFKEGEERNVFMKGWTEVMHAPSEQVFEDCWNSFQDRYNCQVPGLVQYIKDTWITPWKRSIIWAYTDQVLHLGNWVISRVEGAHSTVKSYLQVSTGNLKMVYDNINLLLANQHIKYEAGVATNRARLPYTATHPLFAQLLGQVSHYALGEIWKQKHLLSKPEPLAPCTGAFQSSMGMPCAHQIQALLRENRSLTLEDVHGHWHFLPRTPEVAQPLVLEPAIAETRDQPEAAAKERRRPGLNRAARARQITSTLRQPSAFERIDGPAASRRRTQNQHREMADA
jgi:hypothetical protein